MTGRTLVWILIGCLMSISVMAQKPPTAKQPAAAATTTTVAQNVQDAIEAVEKLVKAKAKDRDVGDLKLKRTRLENELKGLKEKADAIPSNGADQDWYAKALAASAEAKKILDPPNASDFIKGTKPMTAVLFSSQSRNAFEVVKDTSLSADSTIGIINQSQAGGTGGILIAAEAPLAFPKKGKSVYPVGAWYGVNLKTGGDDDVSDVSLAAGFSFSLISAKKLEKLKEGEGAGLSGSARILLGVVYGEVATLGPESADGALKVGGKYPLGESPPLNKDKKLTFAFGLGFRF